MSAIHPSTQLQCPKRIENLVTGFIRTHEDQFDAQVPSNIIKVCLWCYYLCPRESFQSTYLADWIIITNNATICKFKASAGAFGRVTIDSDQNKLYFWKFKMAKYDRKSTICCGIKQQSAEGQLSKRYIHKVQYEEGTVFIMKLDFSTCNGILSFVVCDEGVNTFDVIETNIQKEGSKYMMVVFNWFNPFETYWRSDATKNIIQLLEYKEQ
eukprot:985124_1